MNLTKTWDCGVVEGDMIAELTKNTLTIKRVNKVTTSENVSRMKSYIGINAPWINESITEIIIEDDINNIGENAFLGCIGVKLVKLSNSLKEIHNSAFYKCSNLKSIYIPESVTRIGAYAFSQCSIEKIILPNSLEIIGESAFRDCKSLKSITIPENVRIIGAYIFWCCDSLDTIINESVVPQNLNCGIFRSETYEQLKLYVPETGIDFYKKDYYWSHFKNIISIEDIHSEETNEQIEDKIVRLESEINQLTEEISLKQNEVKKLRFRKAIMRKLRVILNK